jgi:hypothetical protein
MARGSGPHWFGDIGSCVEFGGIKQRIMVLKAALLHGDL